MDDDLNTLKFSTTVFVIMTLFPLQECVSTTQSKSVCVSPFAIKFKQLS